MFFNDAEKVTQKEKDLLISTLKKVNPGMVGISVGCSALVKIANEITHLIRSQLSIPVFWGGAHAIILPEKSIEVADFVCAGEGEILLKRLLNSYNDSHQDISSRPSLWVRQNGMINSSKNASADQIFCNLPFPDYSQENKFFINNNSIKHGDPFRVEPWLISII